MKICQAVLKLWSGHKIVNTQRAITPKAEKQELWFMCSAPRVMVFIVRVKFHEICQEVLKFHEICQEFLKLWSRHENC